MKDLLKKEKLLSNKIKELKQTLLEKEATLYKFDEYENLQTYIEKLKQEIKEIKGKPMNFGELLVDEYFRIPPTLFELKLSKIKNKKIESNKSVSIIPEDNSVLRQIMSNIIISKEIENFMISIREKLIESSIEKLKKIEADIDSEII